MNGKKIAIVAVVLFLILGVGSAVFADDPNNVIEPNNNSTTPSGNTFTPSEDKNKNPIISEPGDNVDNSTNELTPGIDNEEPSIEINPSKPSNPTFVVKPPKVPTEDSKAEPNPVVPSTPELPSDTNDSENKNDNNQLEDNNENNNQGSNSDNTGSNNGGTSSGSGSSNKPKPPIEPEQPEEKNEIDKIIEDIKQDEITEEELQAIKDLIAKIKEDIKNSKLTDTKEITELINVLKDKLDDESLDSSIKSELEQLIKELEQLVKTEEILKDIDNINKDELTKEEIKELEDLIDKIQNDLKDDEKLDDKIIEEIKDIIDSINKKLEDDTLDDETREELENIKNELENILIKEEIKNIEDTIDKVREDLKNGENINVEDLEQIIEDLKEKLEDSSLSDEVKDKINNIIKEIEEIIKAENILEELDKLIEELKKNSEENSKLIEELEKLKEELLEKIANGEAITDEAIKDLVESILANNPDLSEEEKDILDNLDSILNDIDIKIELYVQNDLTGKGPISNNGYTNKEVNIKIEANAIKKIIIDEKEIKSTSNYNYESKITTTGVHKVTVIDTKGNTSEMQFTIVDKNTPHIKTINYEIVDNKIKATIYVSSVGTGSEIESFNSKNSQTNWLVIYLNSIYVLSPFEITNEDYQIVDTITLKNKTEEKKYDLIYEKGILYFKDSLI